MKQDGRKQVHLDRSVLSHYVDVANVFLKRVQQEQNPQPQFNDCIYLCEGWKWGSELVSTSDIELNKASAFDEISDFSVIVFPLLSLNIEPFFRLG